MNIIIISIYVLGPLIYRVCSVGDVNESRCLSESLSRCAKIVNVICPTEEISKIPNVFGVAPEALAPAKVKPQEEGSTLSNLSMVQLVCLPEGGFQCTDVTTCLDTVITVLRRARVAILLFLLPIIDLLGKKASWVSDLRRVILNSGIRCQLSLSPNVETSLQRLHVIFTNQGEFTDKSSNFVTKIRASLRDQLGLTIFNHELWHWTKESKILPLTESQQCGLLEVLNDSAVRQLPCCEWMELENVLLKKKCSRTEKENYQEVVEFARRKCAKLQTVFGHMQQIGLLLYFPPGDGLVEEAKETKSASKHAGHELVAWSTNSGDSGFSQGFQRHHSLSSILHPSTFSSSVNVLSDLCCSLDMELNNCLIPVARLHGLLPKRPILEELHKFPNGFSHAVHWSGILIDPAYHTGTIALLDSSQNTKDTELQHLYLFPAALQSKELPPLHNYTTICPLAYRQPGVMQVDIPLIVFYLLIGHLMKYFSKVLSCGKHGFRFLVDRSHLLDVEYKGYYVRIAVHVPNQKSDPSITAQICKSVKVRVTTCLKYVVETARSYKGLSLEPSVLLSDDINSPGVHVDFVDFPDSDPSSTSKTFVSVGGLDVKLPDDILYWYGRPDQVCSLIFSMM